MKELQDQLMDRLAQYPALFFSQLATTAGVSIDQLERAVEALEGTSVLVVDHPSPDPHIHADLRIVSRIVEGKPQAAFRNADRVWQAWVREILQSHRCT